MAFSYLKSAILRNGIIIIMFRNKTLKKQVCMIHDVLMTFWYQVILCMDRDVPKQCVWVAGEDRQAMWAWLVTWTSVVLCWRLYQVNTMMLSRQRQLHVHRLSLL